MDVYYTVCRLFVYHNMSFMNIQMYYLIKLYDMYKMNIIMMKFVVTNNSYESSLCKMRVYVYGYVCMCVCMYVYVYVYIYIYIYISVAVEV